MSRCQDELPGSADGLLLQRKIDEKWLEFQTPLEKKLDELTQKVIDFFPTEKNVEWPEDPPPHIDSVTGAYSVRFLDEVLTWETARADRYQYPLTMLLIDLDRFRHVNDIYGHVAGNKVLTSVARLLRFSVREADVVFRSGDDEFMVLLPFTHLSDAVQVRGRILRRVRTSDLLPGRPGRVSVT